KTAEDIRTSGIKAGPCGRANIPRSVKPGPSPKYLVLSARWAGGICHRAGAVITIDIPILAPLPNISAHIIQSQTIRLPLPYGMRLFLGIAIEPCVLPEFGVAARACPLFFLPSAP